MCEVLVDHEPYFPGQTITGKIDCLFNDDTKILCIDLAFEGVGHVQLGIKNPIIKNEKYGYLRTEVIKDVRCAPGRSLFPFSFVVPHGIPGSVNLNHGHVHYYLTALLYCADNRTIEAKKRVLIDSCIDLNNFPIYQHPVGKSTTKNMLPACIKSSHVTFDIRLHQGAYCPSQSITFTVKVRNMSHVNVSGIRFKLVQVFKMLTEDFNHEQCKTLAQEQDSPNGIVESGTEKTITLQLQIPAETVTPDLTRCNIIKMHCELIGTIKLPFPYFNMKLRIPFNLGSVPIKNTLL